MGKLSRYRVSHADQLRKNDASLKFLAAAFDREVPAHLLNNLPQKREIRRPVDKRPVGPSEHQVQASVVSWWALQCGAYQLPYFSLFAIPNGGARDVITGARLKAEGVRRGCPDLMLAVPRGAHNGLFIELKVGDNKTSDAQDAFLQYLNDAGYKAVTHWSADSAIEEIKSYLGFGVDQRAAA